MKPYEQLLASWRGEEPLYDRSVTHGEIEVAALEARYGVRLPPAFRDYVLHPCRTVDDAGLMDDNDSAWWGLDRLKSVSEECQHPLTDAALEAERETALFFADYAMWCMAWAVCCNPGPTYGRIFIVSGQDRFVASDFAEFFDQYLSTDRFPL